MKTKLVGGIATGALLLGAFAPATFASTVKVHGNGAGSSNTVVLSNSNTSTTKQVNKTGVVNLTGVVQNTGGNKTNGNTGKGGVSVNTGNTSSKVTNTTTAGGNIDTAPCGCMNPSDENLKISGNGKGSSNTIVVSDSSSSSTTQVNKTLVINGTFVLQNTGGNSANSNTGAGDVDMTTGNAHSDVTNTTTTGLNVINP